MDPRLQVAHPQQAAYEGMAALLTAAGSAAAICNTEGDVLAIGRNLEREVEGLSPQERATWRSGLRRAVASVMSGDGADSDLNEPWPATLVPVTYPAPGMVLVRVKLPRVPGLPAHLRRSLTRREADVALGILDGLQSRAIAQDLGVSVHTVRRITERVYTKLGVHRRGELTLRALGIADRRQTGRASSQAKVDTRVSA